MPGGKRTLRVSGSYNLYIEVSYCEETLKFDERSTYGGYPINEGS